MAILIKKGDPDPNEVAAFEALSAQFSDEWAIFTNLPRASFRQEVDALLVGPRGVVAIELKYWRGDIVARALSPWTGGDGSNPCDQAESAAQKIKSYLERKNPQLSGKVFIKGIALMTHPGSTLEIEDSELRNRVTKIDSASSLIQRVLANQPNLVANGALRDIFSALKEPVPPSILTLWDKPEPKPIAHAEGFTTGLVAPQLAQEIAQRPEMPKSGPLGRNHLSVPRSRFPFALVLCIVGALLAGMVLIWLFKYSSPVGGESQSSAHYQLIQNSNERAGPGTAYAKRKVLATGESVDVAGRAIDSAGRGWLKLADGGFVRETLARQVTPATVVKPNALVTEIYAAIPSDDWKFAGAGVAAIIILLVAARAGHLKTVLIAFVVLVPTFYVVRTIISVVTWVDGIVIEPAEKWRANISVANSAFERNIRGTGFGSRSGGPPPYNQTAGLAAPGSWSPWQSMPNQVMAFNVLGNVRMQCGTGNDVPPESAAFGPPCNNVSWVRFQSLTNTAANWELRFKPYVPSNPQ